MKRKVRESALLSSIFYSAESWLTSNLRIPAQIHASTMKQMLGVRVTTCTDISLVEAGEAKAEALIEKQQVNFLRRLTSRANYPGSYIQRVVSLAIETRCPAGIILQERLRALHRGNDILASSFESLQHQIRQATTTRRSAYTRINPALDTHPVYEDEDVPEHWRTAFTRLRLSSHHLAYERGRWSRTPPEQRLCACGHTQTDEHVLLNCALTEPIRLRLNISSTTLQELFSLPHFNACEYCFLVLKTLDNPD